jgi:23S rRNA pseudoU1915 N3-methylase RlmH
MTRVETMSKSGRAGLSVCPRCGGRYGPVKGIEVMRVGNREYVYVFHGYEKRDNGKWVKIRCYLGPVSEYKRVTELHRDFEKLTLLGLVEVKEEGEAKKASLRPRALVYIKQLLSYIRENAKQLEKPELEEVVRELEAALAELKKLVGSEDPVAPNGNASSAQSKSEERGGKRYVIEVDEQKALEADAIARAFHGESLAEAMERALKAHLTFVLGGFVKDFKVRVREL